MALCRDKDICVAMLVPSIQGGLGHDRGLLCHDIDFSTLSHDRNSVSRQGFRAGPGLGRDKGLLVSRQSFPKGGTFLLRLGSPCVTT